MKKLTKFQEEVMEYCQKQIDDARKQVFDISNVDGRNRSIYQTLLDKQNGIVFIGGKYSIRTLRALESRGLIEILEDNSGIGMGGLGAFLSKIRILNY